jgi:hypothetical protein
LAIDFVTGGLIWLMEWNPLQHALNSGLLALFYSDYLVAANISAITCSGDIFTPKEIRSFAAIQVLYPLTFLAQEMMVDFILFFLPAYSLSFSCNQGRFEPENLTQFEGREPGQMTDKIYNDIPIKYTSKFYWYCSHIGELTCKGKPI